MPHAIVFYGCDYCAQKFDRMTDCFIHEKSVHLMMRHQSTAAIYPDQEFTRCVEEFNRGRGIVRMDQTQVNSSKDHYHDSIAQNGHEDVKFDFADTPADGSRRKRKQDQPQQLEGALGLAPLNKTYTDAEGMVVCSFCDFKSLYSHNVRRHLEIRHGIPSSTQPISREPRSQNRMFSCDYCNYETRFKHNLKRHMKMKHVEVECSAPSFVVNQTFVSPPANNIEHGYQRQMNEQRMRNMATTGAPVTRSIKNELCENTSDNNLTFAEAFNGIETISAGESESNQGESPIAGDQGHDPENPELSLRHIDHIATDLLQQMAS